MQGGILIERSFEETSDIRFNGIVFKVLDAVKEVLEYDRRQRQPLFLSVNEQTLIKLIKSFASNPKKRCLIGIAGESASGKTTFVNYAAKALRKELCDETYCALCCDDYYKDTSMQLKAAGSFEALYKTGFSFDRPNAVNLELMRAHLTSLKYGCGVNSPEYDFITCESIPDRNHKNPARAVLAEGLYVLDAELVSLFDIKIYVFTPFEIIKERWFKRAVLRGKTGLAAEMQFKDVNEAAQIYIRPAMKNADIVINGLSSAEYIEEITSKIVNLVKNTITAAACGNSSTSINFSK